IPVGRCVIRTAESVVLTLWPPGPEERNTSISRSLGLMSTSASSASGITATVAVDVWTRPADPGDGSAWARPHIDGDGGGDARSRRCVDAPTRFRHRDPLDAV